MNDGAATPPAQSEGSPDVMGPFGRRFACLDALRGLAALAVVVAHVCHVEPLGAAAVLVFFVISGYCVTAAADAALQAGVGLRVYMWRRVKRIYPPYLLSIAFFVATRMARDWLAPRASAQPFSPDLLEWVQNATLTQWLSLPFSPVGWPHDNPVLFVSVYWSLCYEEQFYVLVGLLAFLASTRRMAVSVVVTAFALAWVCAFPERCFGWFVEYWPMFAVGSLVYFRLCRMPRPQARLATDLCLLAASVVSAVLAWELGGGPSTDGNWWGWNGTAAHRNAFGDLALAALFGLSLVMLRRVDSRYARNRWLSSPLGWLGAISYSLYLTHNFNLRLTEEASKAVASRVGLSDSSAWRDALQIVGLIVIATGFYVVAERPFLNKPLPR